MKSAGGGRKRSGRKPTRVESDDRPRGYEARRMRELWRDIDQAKRKAGLGRAPDPPPSPGWDLTGVLERAAVLATEAAAWVTSSAPIALALLATGVDLLRNVPVVGRVVDLVPTLPGMPPSAQKLPPGAAGNGHARPPLHVVELDPDGDGPDGKWMH
jgi:hypothetical protein